MIKYIALNKDTGEETELMATIYSLAVTELLDILDIEVIQKTVQSKPKPCITCGIEFTPIDRRFLKCDDCRNPAKWEKSEHTLKCWTCSNEFTTTDGRIHNCLDCRSKSRIKPEYERECARCTREYTTTDKRLKYCSYCITRDYFVNYSGAEKIACRDCDRDICLEQIKPQTCLAIWAAYKK